MSLACPPALTDRPSGAAVAVALAGLLAGCGARDPASTQAAARVNKDEITVHQIGTLIAEEPRRHEPMPQAERRILERLIDRQLAVQQAAELRLDREPKVVQAIESARQEIIARAYADRLAEGAPRPTAAEVKKYYDDHPELFRDRKIYQLQEFAIEADAAQVDALRTALPGLQGADALVAYLQSQRLRHAATANVRAAEQIPLTVLPALARLREGEALLRPGTQGASVWLLQGSRPQPVDEAGAARVIEQFLHNERKRRLLADDVKALRAAARIEYLGRFAASAPAANDPLPSAAATEAGASATAAGFADNGAASAPMPAIGIDASTVNKGLGLK